MEKLIKIVYENFEDITSSIYAIGLFILLVLAILSNSALYMILVFCSIFIVPIIQLLIGLCLEIIYNAYFMEKES